MSSDLYFALTLIVKMAVTAGFLLAATVTAERFGPLVGGLVATLPISAGPVYMFLALDHDAHFIAQSALGSLVTNAVQRHIRAELCAAGAKALAAGQPGRRLRSLVCARCWASERWPGRLPSAIAAERRRDRIFVLAVGAVAARADAARAAALV